MTELQYLGFWVTVAFIFLVVFLLMFAQIINYLIRIHRRLVIVCELLDESIESKSKSNKGPQPAGARGPVEN